MNIQIVKPQPGPQAAFIQCTADVVCYGGARGGGKSWAIALDFWLHAERHGEDARGLILRKTREDLKDFIDTAGHMYAGSARYSEKGNFFKFTTGAKLYCGYLEREADANCLRGGSDEPNPSVLSPWAHRTNARPPQHQTTQWWKLPNLLL